MVDRVFGPGEGDDVRHALAEQDTRLLFDGRTVVVEAVFRTVVDPGVLASRVREACAGTRLRLNVGTLLRRGSDLALVSRSFVNTDEPPEEVGARVAAISPKPEHVTAGLVRASEAASMWAELHRLQDGGD